VDTTWLGFYSIASAMVAPMISFSSSLSASLYRSFTRQDRVARQAIITNSAFLVACAAVIGICARPLIAVVLTEKYLPATGLVYILLLTALFQGLYQPFNYFLGAHGKGRELKRISFVVSMVNLGAAAVLIPPLGAFGAAMASSIAKLVDLMGNLYYYRKLARQLQTDSPIAQPKSEVLCS
jgi:O-antigen/teichoic acid export membrane protein